MVARAWRKEGKEGYYLIDTEFSIRKKVLEMDNVMAVEDDVLSTTELYI